MKLTNNTLLTSFKPLSLALLLAVSTSNSMAADEMTAPAENTQNAVIDSETVAVNNLPETYNNEDWQTPVVVEFNKLDRTGNGLLLPNEATRGKAFNKTTFKQADADKDGSIDINEYIFFKTGKMPETANPEPSAQAKPKMLAAPQAPMLNETNYFL